MARPRKQAVEAVEAKEITADNPEVIVPESATIDPGIEAEIVDPVIPDPDTVIEGEGIEAGVIPADSPVIIESADTPDPGKISKAKSYVIAAPFVDKDNFSRLYNVGEDIPASFDNQRIEALLKLGLIKEK